MLKDIMGKLEKVHKELEAGDLCEEEQEFLVQRASYLLGELAKVYRGELV